jgi:hypothetical protein
MVPPYTAWRRLIERYLNRELSLELNPRERLRPVSDGEDFLGYIVRRDYRLVRRRVVAALKARLRDYRELLGRIPSESRDDRIPANSAANSGIPRNSGTDHGSPD